MVCAVIGCLSLAQFTYLSLEVYALRNVRELQDLSPFLALAFVAVCARSGRTCNVRASWIKGGERAGAPERAKNRGRVSPSRALR